MGTHPWTNTAFDRLPPRPLLPVGASTAAFLRPVLASRRRDRQRRASAPIAKRRCSSPGSIVTCRMGLTVSYHEDAMPRGAAGAVRDAADASDADVFVVADGTAIPNVDLTDLARGPSRPGRGRDRRVTRRGPVATASRLCRCRAGSTSSTGGRSPARSRARLLRHQGKPDSAAAPRRASASASTPPSIRARACWTRRATARSTSGWSSTWSATRTVPEGYVLSGSCLVHRDATIARTRRSSDRCWSGPAPASARARSSSDRPRSVATRSSAPTCSSRGRRSGAARVAPRQRGRGSLHPR